MFSLGFFWCFGVFFPFCCLYVCWGVFGCFFCCLFGWLVLLFWELRGLGFLSFLTQFGSLDQIEALYLKYFWGFRQTHSQWVKSMSVYDAIYVISLYWHWLPSHLAYIVLLLWFQSVLGIFWNSLLPAHHVGNEKRFSKTDFSPHWFCRSKTVWSTLDLPEHICVLFEK